MPRLDGKVVIITGAARGQGEVAAEIFANEDAQLLLSDILPESERVAARLAAQGKPAVFPQQEVVNLALDLASDEASFMTGVIIPVDGGLSARINRRGEATRTQEAPI